MNSLIKLPPGFKLAIPQVPKKVDLPKGNLHGFTKKVTATAPKLTSEVANVFLQTVQQHKIEVAEKIALGELDRHGNPLGTEYWDEKVGIRKAPRAKVGKYSKTKIVLGMVFGDLVVVKRAPKPKHKPARANLSERWACRCSCERLIVVPRYYLLRKPNPKVHCGCKVATLKSTYQREYRIWMMIHQRCFNPNHTSYHHYQKRGITLFQEWNKANKDGFAKFFAEVGKAPSTFHTLDRVHNGRGYFPGNLRWATSEEQRANQGDRIGGFTNEELVELGLTEDEAVELIIQGKLQ